MIEVVMGPLRKFTRTPDVALLRRQGDTDALRRCLTHRDIEVRWDAVLELHGLKYFEDVEPTVGELLGHGVESARQFTAYLSHDGPNRRTFSAVAFLRWRQHLDAEGIQPMIASLVVPLVAAMHHDDHSVRQFATMVLGAGGDSRAVEPLLEALDDPAWRVRQAAAEALGLLRDERAAEGLTRALADPDSEVRKHAAASLGKLRTEARDAADALMDTLRSRPRHEHGMIAAGLRDLGDSATESLIEALEDDDPQIRLWGAQLLGNLSPEHVVAPLMNTVVHDEGIVTIGGMSLPVRQTAMRALENLDQSAVPFLIPMLESDDPELRRHAKEMLQTIGGALARNALAR